MPQAEGLVVTDAVATDASAGTVDATERTIREERGPLPVVEGDGPAERRGTRKARPYAPSPSISTPRPVTRYSGLPPTSPARSSFSIAPCSSSHRTAAS